MQVGEPLSALLGGVGREFVAAVVLFIVDLVVLEIHVVALRSLISVIFSLSLHSFPPANFNLILFSLSKESYSFQRLTIICADLLQNGPQFTLKEHTGTLTYVHGYFITYFAIYTATLYTVSTESSFLNHHDLHDNQERNAIDQNVGGC